MRRLGFVFLFVMASLLGTGFALAERRVALVVGNWEHQRSLGRATTIENDTRDMAKRLRELGYDVLDGYNLNRQQFESLRRDFLGRIAGADVALAYYAGHGVQADASNYIVPVGSSILTQDDLRREGIDIDELVAGMAAASNNSVLLLDSYNDEALRGPAAAAGISAGFGVIHVRSGGYVATAAEPDKRTYSRNGRNSHFTDAILRQLEIPRLDIAVMMLDVRSEVERQTGNLQRPWLNSQLTNNLVLNTGMQAPDNGERDAWEAIVSSTEIDDFERFLRRYPDGIFASTAREKIKLLKQLQGQAANQNPNQLPPPTDTLVRDTQSLLIEVGCLDGRADGEWGRKSRIGLENYARERNLGLVAFEPTPRVLEELRRDHGKRICPVVCSAREELRGDRCVTKTCAAGQELDAKGSCVAVARPRECGPGERVVRGRCVELPPRCEAGERLVRGRCVTIEPEPVRCGRGEVFQGGRCVRLQPRGDGCPTGARRNPNNGYCYFSPLCSPANKGLPGTDQCE